jgi:peptidoglycan/LPS O-acetylase OafA/YrhL
LVELYLSALAATLALAAMSWALIEKPALRAKGRIASMTEGVLGRLPFGATAMGYVGRAID